MFFAMGSKIDYNSTLQFQIIRRILIKGEEGWGLTDNLISMGVGSENCSQTDVTTGSH